MTSIPRKTTSHLLPPRIPIIWEYRPKPSLPKGVFGWTGTHPTNAGQVVLLAVCPESKGICLLTPEWTHPTFKRELLRYARLLVSLGVSGYLAVLEQWEVRRG